MFTCLCHLVSCIKHSCTCFRRLFLFRFQSLFLSPLESFYPIKFIRSNMWMWHQKQRQLCDLHFVFGCVFAFYLSLSVMFSIFTVLTSAFASSLSLFLSFMLSPPLCFNRSVPLFRFLLLGIVLQSKMPDAHYVPIWIANACCFSCHFRTIFHFSLLSFCKRFNDSITFASLIYFLKIKLMPLNEFVELCECLEKTASPNVVVSPICISDEIHIRHGHSPTNNNVWEIMKRLTIKFDFRAHFFYCLCQHGNEEKMVLWWVLNVVSREIQIQSSD